MDDYKNEAMEFAKKILNTEIYQNYIAARNNLDSKPELKSEVDEFRRNTFIIQTGHNYGYYNSYEQMVNLKNANDELLCNPLVKAFMDAEYRLTQMLSDIMNTIVEALDFDMDFLE